MATKDTEETVDTRGEFGTKKVPKKTFELKERSDVDPHEKFQPEKLGLEDWGDGFHVTPEPVVIERRQDGSIMRTTPISEATREQLIPKVWKDGKIVEAEPRVNHKPRKRPQETVVNLLAGMLMDYYSKTPPGALPYNPLYDGIPSKVALGDDFVLQPEIRGDELVHVPAHEVHSWLRQLIGKRAQIMNAKTGKLGWSGDINDLVVSIKR